MTFNDWWQSQLSDRLRQPQAKEATELCRRLAQDAWNAAVRESAIEHGTRRVRRISEIRAEAAK